MIRLFEQRPERFLRLLLIAQLMLWTLIPVFTHANAPLDVVENIGWGREWQMGYYKHPPLQAWLTYGAFLGAGGRMWMIYGLSQVCVVLTQLGNFVLVRDIAGPKRALWAVVLFGLVYYATLATPKFNADLLQMPIWIWSAFALRRAIIRRTAVWWLALGALLALGLYTQYSVLVLIAALAIATLSQHSGRSSLILPWPWLAAGLTATICTPQLIWLKSVDFLPLTYTADRDATATLVDRAHDIGAFLGGQVLAQVLAVVVLLIAGARLAAKPTEPAGPFNDRLFVLIMATAPIVLTVTGALVGQVGLRDMWGAAMSAFLTVAAAVLFDPWARPARFKVALAVWLALFLALPIGAGLFAIYSPMRSRPPKIAFPGLAIAQSLDRIWSDQTATTLRIVAGKAWEASEVAAYSQDRPSVFVDAKWRYNPWITRERVASEGVLVVWTGSEDPPARLVTLGPFQARGHVLARYARGGKMATVNWAIRAPGLPAPVGMP